MITDEGLKRYKQYIEAPWGKMFYKLVFEQLETVINELKIGGLKILDYGSGFGITANRYSTNNIVLGIEPDQNMIKKCLNDFKLINGSENMLNKLNDEEYDLIICHNVFEYTENRKQILNNLFRKLKPNGCISIIKHNLNGKLNSLAVYDTNPQKALELYNGNYKVESDKFGEIKYYNINDLLENNSIKFNIEKQYGIRIFYGNVFNNEIKYDKEWDKQMFQLEFELSDKLPYLELAFWKHYIIKKLP